MRQRSESMANSHGHSHSSAHALGGSMWDNLGPEYEAWPLEDEFPTFLGIAFTDCNDDREGHGVLIRRLTYWDYEVCPYWDGKSFLFRMYYKAEDLKRPDDSAPELRAGLNKHFVQLRYFEADIKKKVFVLLGAEDMDEMTTAPRGSYFRYSDDRWCHSSVTLDDINQKLIDNDSKSRPWKYHALKHRGMQFSLSDDNRVLSNVDYWRHKASNVKVDKFMSAAYFIAQPPTTVSDPRLVPKDYMDSNSDANITENDMKKHICSEITSMSDAYERMLTQWYRCFGESGSRFWSGNESRPVFYNCDFRNVDHVDHEHGTFTATVEIDVQWPLTKLEVIEYLSASAADVTSWTPAWHPPDFYIVNSSSLHPAQLTQTRIHPYHPGSDFIYRCNVDAVALRLEPNETRVKPITHYSSAKKGERVKVCNIVNDDFGVQYVELCDGSGFFPLTDPNNESSKTPFFTWENAADLEEDRRKSQHSTIWANCRWRVQGEFYTVYDLLTYPYDSQTLRVELRTSSPSLRTMFFEPMDRSDAVPLESVIKNPEWKIRPYSGGTHFGDRFLTYQQKDWINELGGELDTKELRSAPSGQRILKEKTLSLDEDSHMDSADSTALGYFQIVCQMDIERRSGVYTQRVIAPMGLFSLLSIGAFSLSQSEYSSDRLAIPVSLLLTSTAYSLTISSEIPRVGYLTVLERYVLMSALYIGFVCFGVIAMNYLDSDLYPETEADIGFHRDKWAVIVGLVSWIILQIWFYTMVRRFRAKRKKSLSKPSGTKMVEGVAMRSHGGTPLKMSSYEA